jgi:sulfite exporter TauE/SafE
MFLTGLLFAAGPCLASCGPILISYIAGTKKDVRQGLVDYILFSSSRIFVYLVLSSIVFFLGRITAERLLGDLSRYILIIGGFYIVLIGIFFIAGKKSEFHSLGVIKSRVLGYNKRNIIFLGLLLGLSPCAPFLAVLSYIGLISKTWLNSLIYGFSFGIATFLSPLLFLVFFTGFIPKLLRAKNEIYPQIISFTSGLIIIFLGIQLIRRAFE